MRKKSPPQFILQFPMLEIGNASPPTKSCLDQTGWISGFGFGWCRNQILRFFGGQLGQPASFLANVFRTFGLHKGEKTLKRRVVPSIQRKIQRLVPWWDEWWKPMFFPHFPMIQSVIFGFDSTQDPTGFQPLISGSRNSHSEEVEKEFLHLVRLTCFFYDAKIMVS